MTDTAYTGPGRLFNSGDWDGLDVESGKRAAITALEAPRRLRRGDFQAS